MADRVARVRRGHVCLCLCFLMPLLVGPETPGQAAPAAGHTYVVNSPLDCITGSFGSRFGSTFHCGETCPPVLLMSGGSTQALAVE